MKHQVHYYHTACLALAAGWTPDEALDIAFFDHLTDEATPTNVTKDWWPDATGLIPRITQLTIKDAARLLAGENWWPGFEPVHDNHFGGGPGGYGRKEYETVVQRIKSLHAEHLESGVDNLAALGRAVHLGQDFASHHDYRGYPSAKNRLKGDSRTKWQRLKHWVVRSTLSDDNIMGHVLRPEVDDLENARDAIRAVTCDLYQALRRRGTPDVCEALPLLHAQSNDALKMACRAWWKERTGRDFPDFRFPSPQSAAWKRWCRRGGGESCC
jgi:hypothetical protein